ncbi:membrane protein [Legionella norrlandica]|uniref:Membrane protein n=1 Tax=Legionella norrlandica TaxID=1498499 RepID=A0A0A2SUE9_9GAMM|nr:membrane protein [Legionella norrlandica]
MTTATLKLPHRLIYFIGIGAGAAFVHLLVVFNLVHFLNIQPIVSNVIAFLVAFNISYFGHRYLTFSQLQDEKQLSLPHFFLVASSAGLLNEALYYLLLHYTALNYLISLIFVLGLVAVYNYILSRFWACR